MRDKTGTDHQHSPSTQEPRNSGTQELRPDLFVGTAWYYARYRPGYPEAFIAHLVARFGLDGGARALDLGCGTGQLALPLARHAGAVVGLDPEPEMLAEAAERARAAGVANASWVAGGSGDLSALRERLGHFRLVTMGASFHWMDRAATLRELDRLVEPGGGLAVTGGGSFWTGALPWQRAVKGVVQRWLGEGRRAGSGTYTDPPERHEAVMARSAFRTIELYRLNYQLRWDVDHIVGWLYSSSFCSLALLGDKREPFERDLRATLRRLDPAGEFVEDVAFEAILAWRG